MKAIQVKCGSCGANLEVEDGSSWVTCAYCRVKSKIEAPAAPATSGTAAVPGAPASQTSRSEQANRPLADDDGATSAGTTLGTLLLPLLVVIFAGSFWYGVGTIWAGRGAVFADVNGDGIADPIGYIRPKAPSDRVHIAAFDGKSGSRLWRGEKISSFSDFTRGPLSVAESAVLYGRDKGEVWAFDLEDGELRWKAPVGDKVERFCQASQGRVGVLTVDDKHQLLNLKDGTAEEIDGDCEALADEDLRLGLEVEAHPSLKVDGMRVNAVYRRPGDVTIVAGSVRQGTAVPMLAAVDSVDGTLHWKTEVPGVDRLGAEPGAPAQVDVDDAYVAAAFEADRIDDPSRLALFAKKDGRRHWEIELPNDVSPSSVRLTDHAVYVTIWTSFAAYELETGEEIFSIN